MTLQVSDRLGIHYPDGPSHNSVRPDRADVPTDLLAIIGVIDPVMFLYDQGVLADRPVSTSGSPGIKGRGYLVHGDSTNANNDILWLDYGTGWLGFDSRGFTLGDRSITNVKIALNTLTGAEIADGAIGTGELADAAVTAAKIADALKPSAGAGGGTEALRAIGSGAGQVVAGSDARLTDQRVPTDGSVTSAKIAASAVTGPAVAAGTLDLHAKGAAATLTDAEVAAANKDGAQNVASMRTLGTGHQQAAAGDDPRFGSQFARAERTGNVSLPGSASQSTATTILGATASIAFDGATEARIEIYIPEFVASSPSYVILLRDSTVLGAVWTTEDSSISGGVFATVFDTPSNASHTYTVKAYTSNSVGATVRCGSSPVNAFLRVSKS